jgi:hypothetical protein
MTDLWDGDDRPALLWGWGGPINPNWDIYPMGKQRGYPSYVTRSRFTPGLPGDSPNSTHIRQEFAITLQDTLCGWWGGSISYEHMRAATNGAIKNEAIEEHVKRIPGGICRECYIEFTRKR